MKNLKKSKYLKSTTMGLVALALLFGGGFWALTKFPQAQLFAMNIMPSRLAAAISLNFCRSSIIIDSKTNTISNPVCVARPQWCYGEPTLTYRAGSGTWTNGSPGWQGDPPGYGAAMNGIGVGRQIICNGKATSFPNGGNSFWFWEPSNTSAAYADNVGSRAFDVIYPAAKQASMYISQPSDGEVMKINGGMTVDAVGTPPEAFKNYDLIIGNGFSEYSSKPHWVDAPKASTPGTQLLTVIGFLNPGYYCISQSGVSNNYCISSINLTFTK